MQKRPSAAYSLFMLALCVFALLVLMLEVVYRGNAEISVVLDYADTAICVIFFGDFLNSLVRAPNRWRYMITWGWVDLISSIPALDVARWGRLARIARIARLLRALRAGRTLSTALFRERSQSAALTAALLALFLIVGSSAAILHFEDHPQANIKTANDAIWWAFATITTVGYGDRYPVSNGGRIIAAVLMSAGVGLFGAFSAALATWFLASDDEASDKEMTALREEIAQLREAITTLTARPPGAG